MNKQALYNWIIAFILTSLVVFVARKKFPLSGGFEFRTTPLDFWKTSPKATDLLQESDSTTLFSSVYFAEDDLASLSAAQLDSFHDGMRMRWGNIENITLALPGEFFPRPLLLQNWTLAEAIWLMQYRSDTSLQLDWSGDLPPYLQSLQLHNVQLPEASIQKALTQIPFVRICRLERRTTKGDTVQNYWPSRWESPLYLQEADFYSLNISDASPFPEMPYIQSLRLAYNQLTKLPEAMRGCRFLRELDLSSNKIVEFPTEILAFKHLKKIDLSSNPLSAIPEAITRLEQLEWIDLSFTNLKTAPHGLVEMPLLRYLELPSTLDPNEKAWFTTNFKGELSFS